MTQPAQVTEKEANDIHNLLLSDPAFYWEGSSDGCFARALLMIDRMQREGVPPDAISKILVIHKRAPSQGFIVSTRLGGTQFWMQHVTALLRTTVGPLVIDPMLAVNPEAEQTWLQRFPGEPLNFAIALPTPAFIQALLRASDASFRLLLALASKQPPEYFKHILSDPHIATRLEHLGDPVRHWLELIGPVAERFDPHLAALPALVQKAGPLVRGEVVRVSFGLDFFLDVSWDTVGKCGSRGLARAWDELAQIKDNATP